MLGTLNFACSTVRAGRVFMSRIINSIKQFPKEGKRRVSGQLKLDLKWWDTYLEEFNGLLTIPDIRWQKPGSVIETDASMDGVGGWS